AFCRYLTQQLRPAVDEGVEAVHLEEPEFWDEGGYSEGFKREYRDFYGEDWQPPHLSCENRYKASALKVYLYKRLVEYVSRELKAYAKEKYSRDLRFYVSTHSLLNYTQWKILSPEGTLLDIPTVDGCIAQVWTGTSRCGNVYAGRYDERTFETAFLEYGIMQELVRGTGRSMWFLHDPVEDNPEYTWEDFRKNYLKTVIASLMHPAVHRYEVSPWPTRVMTGIYPKRSAMGSGIKPGEAMAGAKPIPPSYASLLCAMIQTLGDMDQKEASFEGAECKIGIFMADSGLYQRTFPDSVAHSEKGVTGLHDILFSLVRRQKAGECTRADSQELMARIADDAGLYNDYVASGAFPHFFGMAMPLMKGGVPLRPVQLENVTRYQDYLADYDVLILSYEMLKPRQMELHDALADWVRNGGTLIYVGDGSDPYHQAQSWWNTGACSYPNPAAHLFEQLGLEHDPAEGVYTVGQGKLALRRISPARLTLSADAAQAWREWVRANAAPGLQWKNHFLMKRGPYRIAAVMEESVSSEPLTLRGRFADLLTNDFTLVTEKTLTPGENALLFDLDAISDENIRIVGTGARIESLQEREDDFHLACKAAADVRVFIRLKLPSRVTYASAKDESGAQLNVHCTWDHDSSTVLLSFDSTNSRTEIHLMKE
ncbi:MAG: hypothetical protein IKK75_05585, partial [Clostridia bacterium]|nr:hypothetical protein [Clostridia bacterium]